MITINKIEDLKKYVKIVPADKYDGKHKQIIFEFMKMARKQMLFLIVPLT